jgi:hypothetical protein
VSELEPIEPIQARRVVPSGVTALDRATGFLRWLAGRILRLAVLGLAGGALVWWALSRAVPQADRLVLLTAIGILLVVPPTILGLLGLALRTLAALPARLREAPGEARGRIHEARRRLAEVADARRRGMFSGFRALLRLGWSLRSSREVLEIAGPAALFLTPWMLAAAVVAVIAAVAEILAGGFALLWLALR